MFRQTPSKSHSRKLPQACQSRFQVHFAQRGLVLRKRRNCTGLTAQETLPYHYPDHRSEDRSGQEVRAPMDGHEDADAHVKGVDYRYTPQPPLFRPKREDRDAHGKRDRRMRGRPTPEDSAAQKAESENVAQIGTHAVRGMDAARERLIDGSDKSADEFGLTDRPTGQTNSSASGKDSDSQQEERQDYGQESADMDGWKHPGTKFCPTAGCCTVSDIHGAMAQRMSCLSHWNLWGSSRP